MLLYRDSKVSKDDCVCDRCWMTRRKCS